MRVIPVDFSITKIVRPSREVISHRFFQSSMVNVGVKLCEGSGYARLYVERIFSLSNILNFTLSELNCIDDVPGRAISSGFNLKVLPAVLLEDVSMVLIGRHVI